MKLLLHQWHKAKPSRMGGAFNAKAHIAAA
jgi:hypothetical protein